ncbi:MAG: hypothetical protein LQ347_005434, partial [Umbilicaria vellea]
RSDPFQFGSRYLEEGDDVYEFNAWDHVPTDAVYNDYALLQYARQRSDPVSAFDKQRFNADPAKWWNRFYRHHTSNFFKDRKWLRQEFPVLTRLTTRGAGARVVLEVGAGAGNSAFPIVAANENAGLRVWACDFSTKAVQLIRANAAFDDGVMRAEVWDVASETETLPAGLEEGSVDVVLMIFVFSALAPAQWAQAVRNVWRALKPGGEVCLRDYGRGDLAQVRFKKGRYLDENFYVRGDGTRVYFFEKEELERIWGGEGLDGAEARRPAEAGVEESGQAEEDEEQCQLALSDEEDGSGDVNDSAERQGGFEILSLGVDRRLLVNRQRKLKMYRCWMQGRFRKRDDARNKLGGSPGDRGPFPAEESSQNDDQSLST